MSHTASAVAPEPWVAFKRYLRKPKPLLVLVLVGVGLLAALGPGFAMVAPEIGIALLVAMAVDAPILRLRKGRWEVPDGALLTGMLIGMILSPLTPWYVVAAATAIAIVSKYLLRTHTANIFNPAALALVVVYPLFAPGEDWWGAMPEITPYALAALILGGLFIADRVNKVPALLAFLGVYYLAFTLTAFLGDPALVAGIYRAPDLNTALFFGFFMVTDPPTSPPRHREQILYGMLVAAVSFGIFISVGGVFSLPAGLMAGNAWEAWRRSRIHARRHLHSKRATA